MAGTQAKGASHTDAGWNCPPESLTLEKNPASPFYSEDINEPLPEGFIDNIQARGVIYPVCVVRDGERFVVTDGRKRWRAVMEANRRRVKAGEMPFTIGYFIRRTRGEADIIGLSAAANLHVDDSPLRRARKPLRMQEAGAPLENIANDFGVTKQCVENWMVLLDCAAPVQKWVDNGGSEAIARKLAGLDREKQREVFEEMVAKGSTRGAAASRAVTSAKKGRGVPEKSTTKRMRNQAEVQALLDGLQSLNGEMKDETKPVVNVLRWVLRQCEPTDLCDDCAAILLPEAGEAEKGDEAQS